MLERASSCLEPVVQNVFRSIEVPTRSQRRLPNAFWRRALDGQEHTSWWPAYLDDIRRLAQAREASNDGSHPAQRVGTRLLPFASQQFSSAEDASSYNRQKAKPNTRRHISKIVKQSRLKDEKAFEEALEPEDEGPPPAEVALFTPEGIPKPRKPHAELTAAQRLGEILRAGSEPKYNTVWLAFISLKEQAGFARAVLRYLSRSSTPVILRRALRTFQMIEVEDRTHLTYESAVRAAIGLRKYAPANEFVLEALQRGLGAESSQFLMGHLVEKQMWKSAIRALRVFVDNTKSMPANRNITNWHVSQYLQESPVWKTVDGMLSLPQKLIELSEKLEKNDAVLVADRENIAYFATRLLERALRSTPIMGAITSEGMLALFDSYHRLGILRIQHYLDALSALRLLRETRNRSQLALLIFRTMRSVYPEYRLHDSTYGTMISILSAAPSEPKAFEYILNDVTQAHDSASSERKLDLAMYQRVMASCAEQGQISYVKLLLDRLIDDHGVPKDLAYFTPLLLSFAKRGDVQGTKHAFDELSRKYDLKPNHQCWNILMLAHARADDFDGAAALFRQMETLGIPADSYTFGTLMSMCSNVGDTDAVLQLVEMARKRQIPASTAILDTIVHSYCLNGQVKEAESLVEAATHMTLSGSPVRMWNILLRHHAFRADSDAVLRTQERMRELAVKPDAMTYAALMTSLVIIGKTKDAAAMLRSLHLGQVVTATRFHYSIVFHGYVQEGQRKQAIVIYAEMLKRFHRPSPSAQLAMLHLQSQNDDIQAQQQEADGATGWAGHVPRSASKLQSHSIDFLADVLLEMAETETVSDEPQPGFRRRKALSATSGAFLEVPFAVLNLASSFEKAQKLVGRYQAVIDASGMTKQQKSYQTVQLLTAQLRGVVRSYEGSGRSTAHLRKQSHDQIDAIWSKIFAHVVSSAKERPLHLLKNDLIAPPQRPLSDETAMSSADNGPASLGRLSQANSFRAIPSKRHTLSVPLSVYMRGLAFQQRMPQLESLLKHVQEVGFVLTTKNWNTYVQLLSERQETILQAFCIFEQKLLPNAPPWDLLKRGKVSSTVSEEGLSANADTSKVDRALLPRAMVEKRDPGRLVPTYFTVVHLAAAFIKVYRGQSEEGSDEGIREKVSLYTDLRRQAPGTVKLIQSMPRLKDRVQGVLLRGRAVKGDLLKRQREHQLVDQASLLGSRLTPSNLSSEDSDKLEKTKEADNRLQSLATESQHLSTQHALVPASGRVLGSPKFQQRRTRTEDVKQSAFFKEPHTETQDHAIQMIADDTGGDPYIEDLTPGKAATGLNRRDFSNLVPTHVNMNQAPVPEQSQTRIRLRNSLENLRRTASMPERAPPHWHVRSTRRRQESPRIIAYPVKPLHKLLLKPMSNYMHKDQVFTKPMLTMRIPKRRELGSERRAFDLVKQNTNLKKQRETSICKAQARAKKLRIETSGDVGDEADAAAFLETRRVGGKPRDGEKTVSDEMLAYNTQADMVATDSTPKQKPYPSGTHHAASQVVKEEKQGTTKGADAVDQARKGNGMDFHEARPVNDDPRISIAQSSEKELFLPWGQVGQFDEKEFVKRPDAWKE